MSIYDEWKKNNDSSVYTQWKKKKEEERKQYLTELSNNTNNTISDSQTNNNLKIWKPENTQSSQLSQTNINKINNEKKYNLPVNLNKSNNAKDLLKKAEEYKKSDSTENVAQSNYVGNTENTIDNQYKNEKISQDILGIGENLVRGPSSGLKQTMNYVTAVNKGHAGYNNITNQLARAKYLSTPIDQRNEDDLKKNFIEEAVNNSIAKDNEAISKNINAMSNKTTKKLAELAPSIGQMGTGTVIGLVNPILGGEYFFTSAAGSYLDDAKQRGMNDKQSIMYSTVMGGLEAITEEVGLRNFQKAGGAIKALASGTGKEGVKKAIQEVASKEIETSVKDVLKNYGIGIADNFVQEAIMDPLQEISATAIAGKNKADWSNMGQKMIQDGINGGLVAAIVGGANLGVNSCIGIVEKSSNGQNITQAEYNQGLQDAQKAGVDVQQNIKEKIGEQINNINSNENIAPIQNSNNIQMEQNIEQPKQVIKDFNESARQYNIDYNNEDLKEINQMYNKRGIKAYFDENTFKNNNDAFSIWKPVIDEQGNISSREVVINPNAEDTKTRVQELAVHELGHDLDLNEVQDMILKDASRKENWESARKSLEDTYREAYKNDGINISEKEFNKIVDEEATMSILQRELGSQEYVNRLVNQNQSIAKKIYNWVIDKLNKFTGGKNEKIFWADVKNKFETAYNQEFNKNDSNTYKKYSIQTDNNGNKYVKVDTDQNIFDGIDKKDYNKIAKMYMQDYLMGKTKLSDNDTAVIDRKSANKYTNPGKKQQNFDKKMQLTPELKNVLEIAQKDATSLPIKSNSKYQSWEYYKFNFELSGKKFNGIVNIGIDSNGNKHFYEINKIKEVDDISGTSLNRSPISLSNNSLPSTQQNVNSQPLQKYSMQESENNSGSFNLQENKPQYALPTKEWQQFVEDNYQKQGTGKNLKEYNLPTMQDVKSSNVEQKNQNVKIPMKSDIEKENFNSNMDKYNFYKSRKIKANEEAINSLISYKNESIRSIENKIAEKENALKKLKNSDTKVAANIRNQIENLKVRKSKIENDYNLKIDKFNQKNTKEKLDVETQNEMKKDARETLSEEIKPLLNGIENWKDKDLLGGFRYNRETAQRNTYDVVKDKSQAATINATIFDPIQVHQAEKTRETNKIFNEINNLKLDKTKKYDYVPENDIKPIKIDEATLAQLYIEKKINDTDLKKYNVDVNRIKTISKTFTNILDNLYNQMNETLVEYGYAPIKKIENYFPHFTENKADSTLGKIASYFGIEINNQELPTEIAGKTDTFKPGKTWNANLLKRNTNKTDYDALKILERYVNGAEDIIHTTGDIQRVREFSKQIRYNFSDDGVKERIDNINNNEDLMQFEKEEAIDAIFSQEKNQLSHYVTWLDDYANTLANKKSFSDRNIEREVGRNIYTNMANIESRIAANTIGGNLSVSLTNFAPIFQSIGSTKPINVFMGMIETTKNNILGLIKGEKDTSFVQNSNFLTNRFGTDTISAKTTTQNISDIFSKLMNKIDEFSSESIVRAKYRENLQNGLSEYEALDKADKDTAKIMADRSKGALPIFFNKKNPISKLMTMFQVEPNNIISNYFKDMPQDAETKQQLAYNYGKLMVASYAFNTIIMAVRGGNEVLPDPIRIVSYMIKWLTGDDDDEKEKAKNDLTEALISLVPFVQNAAGLLGYEDIGRIPISNAMPDLTKISSLMDKDVDSNYKKETLIKEISKPLLYLGLPVGGAQINKTIQGIETLKAGGSYTTNKKGERLLQFPVENANILDYGKAVVFGKWSLPEAQNYSKTLNAKQTKIYEESNIPYKELLDYIDKGMTKKEDKLNYLNSTDLTTEQKWGIYKYDILSNTTRADGSSQLQDAEYMINNGVSKEQFINIYNKAQKNSIDIPTQEEYKLMKKSNISLNNYIDYKIKEKEETKKQRDNGTLSKNQSLSNVDKIDILLNSRYSDKEKRGIYENYIKSENDTEYKIMSYTNVDIDEYLKYKQQEFESDYEDDGTTTGKAISNSKQKKVYAYVNSSGMSYEQKLLLLGMKYKLNGQERTTLANYVNNLDITSDEKIKIYEKLEGFTVYKNGNVKW